MTCPFGFLVVLPDQMLLIPVDSDFSWLTMFYMLPKELVESKRPMTGRVATLQQFPS